MTSTAAKQRAARNQSGEAQGPPGHASPAALSPTGRQACEPTPDTPFAAYYGLQVLSRFIQPGDVLVHAASSQSLVQAYAARAPGGGLRVMVVNDDPANSYGIALSVPGYSLAAGAPVLFYGKNSGHVQHLTGPAAAAAEQAAAPYSVTVFTLRRA